MWDGFARRLEGEIVVLEPLKAAHEEGLWAASQHPEIWAWTTPVGESREFFDSWLSASLASSEAGSECVFVTITRSSGEVIGSTRFLALRLEHRGLEIGATWLVPSMWPTGANPEAKLLMLGHAFERLGCMRVEFKTDARNERSRRSLPSSRGSSAGTCSRRTSVSATPRTTARSTRSGQGYAPSSNTGSSPRERVPDDGAEHLLSPEILPCLATSMLYCMYIDTHI